MYPSKTLKIYAPYLRIELKGDLCAEVGYAYSSVLSCVRTELYAYLKE